MKHKLLQLTSLITAASMLLTGLPVYASSTTNATVIENQSDSVSDPHNSEDPDSETYLPENAESEYAELKNIETENAELEYAKLENAEPENAEPEYVESENPEAPEAEVELEIEETVTSEYGIDSEELLQGYLDQCFYQDRGISLFRSFSCGDTLNGQTKNLYDQLSPSLKEVAAGKQNSTVFLLDSASIMDKTQFTSQELSVTSVNEGNARELAAACINYDARLLLNSLLNDMPYELFWFNKQNGGMKITYTLGYTSTYLRIKQFKVSFSVADEYQGGDSYTIDSSKIASIHTAVANAKSIITEASGLSDLKKIEFYKDKICDLTDYNYTAASTTYSGPYGNPWQLIYVFDNDPATKVVCEGYAKAFQYLMDETAFSSWDIYSILVSGTKSGGKHMWNIVHMDDNRNYLVDVTAADSYRTSDPGYRFMEIPEDGTVESGYIYNSRSSGGTFLNGSVYVYDADTLNLYSKDDLLLTDIEYGKQPEPKIICKNDSGNETTISVQTKYVAKANASESILVAVWSRENGQDDLNWYEMNYSDSENAYKTNIPIAKHKTSGIYDAHLYHRSSTGVMTFLARNTFEIHGVQADKLTAEVKADASGTAVVTISGVSCPSGVSRVQFPIWSKPDQSDLVWYEGTKVSDGVYQITMDISRHGFHTGTYQIHTYGTNGIGARNFLLRTTCVMKAGDPALRATRNTSGYTLSASGLNFGDVKEIRFAIWSAKNGQDDLIWYCFKPSAPGAGSINWNPKETGLHYIHCYIVNAAGKLIFQKGIEENVPAPSITSIKSTTNNSTGAFKVTVNGLSSALGIRRVQVAIWTDPNQKDLIWYSASRTGDGLYTVDSNISKHGFRTGIYHAHLYVTDSYGTMSFAGANDFEISSSLGKLTADYSSGSKTSSLLAEGIALPFEADHMSFAVWSEKDGQDDLRWYDTSIRSGRTAATVSTANHKNSTGLYHVHLYAVSKAGNCIFVGKTTFNV